MTRKRAGDGRDVLDRAAHNNVLSSRLKAVREHLRLSQTAMAERAGVAMRTWQDYEAGKIAPGAQALARLHEMGISLPWLLTGEEPMMRSEQQGSTEGLAYIRQYDVRAAAGAGGGLAHSELPAGFLALKLNWVRGTLGRNPADLVLLEAVGDSMEMEIADGDTLLVDVTDRELRQGAVYVFRVDDSIQVKRISRHANGDVVLMSDNARYAPEILSRRDAERLHIIGRVIRSLHSH